MLLVMYIAPKSTQGQLETNDILDSEQYAESTVDGRSSSRIPTDIYESIRILVWSTISQKSGQSVQRYSCDTFAYEQFWELDHLVFNPQLETHMLTSLISRSKVGISGL